MHLLLAVPVMGGPAGMTKVSMIFHAIFCCLDNQRLSDKLKV